MFSLLMLSGRARGCDWKLLLGLIRVCPRAQVEVIRETNQIGVNEGTGRHDLSIQLHQFCFYPRALMTPSDAVFVAKMIRTMHDLGTNGFTTVFAYMQVGCITIKESSS